MSMQNRIMFITGRKGSGKTTYADKLASGLYLRGNRVIIVSPMGGFSLAGCESVTTLEQLVDPKLKDRSFVVLPSDDKLAEAAFLYAYTCGNAWLFVDEIDLYMSAYNCNESLQKIIRYGRHRRVSLVGISQRPANVHRDLTAQADILVMYQTHEPRDVDYLAVRIGKENAERLRSLPLFKPLIYMAGSVVSDPMSKGGDEMETPRPCDESAVGGD